MDKYIMKQLITLFFCCVIIPAPTLFAQDEQPYVKKYFVIVQSVKDYSKAKTTAVKIAGSLKQKLDLRNLKPNKTAGLTYSKKDCENEGGYPCYFSRGRYDNGDYVSIEWSNAFEGFAKGYYIVIIYSGDKEEATAILKKAKPFFKDTYIKQASIYMGCMH